MTMDTGDYIVKWAKLKGKRINNTLRMYEKMNLVEKRWFIDEIKREVEFHERKKD